MANGETLVQPEQDDPERLMAEFLRSRGFKRSLEGTVYATYFPPFLQPGRIAPPGDSGDPDVRKRVINNRKHELGYPEI